MSGPYSAAFSGANTGIPGYSVGPTSQNFGASAPNIPSLGWGSLNAGEAASWANFGVGSGVYHTATHPSNDFIQQQFVIHPWNDGAHLNIAEFQIVCCNRSVADHNFNLYTAVSIAKINELLSDAFATFDAVTAGQDKDAEALEFLGFLNQYGEDKLEMYHKLQKRHGSAEARRILNNAKVAADLEKFYLLATTKPVLRYMTKLGILLQWNVMGVTVGVNRGTGLDERELAATSERISVINTIMAKRATTHNIFGSNKEMCTGADTYLVLRRVARRGANGPGRFEFVPYATRERLGVPRHLAIYSDDSVGKGSERRMVNSHVIPFGVVTQPAGRDAPPGIREVACGLNGNNKVAFEAIATLPTVHVQVGM